MFDCVLEASGLSKIYVCMLCVYAGNTCITDPGMNNTASQPLMSGLHTEHDLQASRQV